MMTGGVKVVVDNIAKHRADHARADVGGRLQVVKVAPLTDRDRLANVAEHFSLQHEGVSPSGELAQLHRQTAGMNKVSTVPVARSLDQGEAIEDITAMRAGNGDVFAEGRYQAR